MNCNEARPGQARMHRLGSRWAAPVVVGVLCSAALGIASPAIADECPLVALVPCSGTGPPTPTPTPTPEPKPPVTTTTTTAPPPRPPATTTTTAPPPAQLTEEQARTRLVGLVNAERTKRGLPAVQARADAVDIATRWSAAMSDAGKISHNDAYFTKESRRRLNARALGENVARNGSIDGAHEALMASEHHRDNILDRRFTVVGFAAVLRDGSWWVTEDFLEPRVAGIRSTPAPAGEGTTPAPAERGRGQVDTTLPAPDAAGVRTGDGEVLGMSSPPSSPGEVSADDAGAGEGPGFSVLAGEDVVNPQLRLASVAAAVFLLGSVLALRRARARALKLAAPSPPEGEESMMQTNPASSVLEPGDEIDGRGLRKTDAVVDEVAFLVSATA